MPGLVVHADDDDRLAHVDWREVGRGTIGARMTWNWTFSAITNGIAAAPFLVVVMMVSGDPKLMGDHVNGRTTQVFGWLTTLIMAVAGVAGTSMTLWPPEVTRAPVAGSGHDLTGQAARRRRRRAGGDQARQTAGPACRGGG